MYASIANTLQVADFAALITNEPALKPIGTYVLTEDGEVCAKELSDGTVVKCSGPVPSGSEFVRYGAKAFKHWTVEDAAAFENGEAVDPWKAN